MASTYGRISELAFKVGRLSFLFPFVAEDTEIHKVASGTLFGIAIAAAILRTVLRMHYKRALALDDVFLLLACIFLTASVTFLYSGVDIMFFEEQLLLDPFSVTFTPNLFAGMWRFQKTLYASLDLSVAAVYCVKFSFLCLFRQLIDRLPGIIIYWKAVTGVCALVFAGAMTAPFVACPYFNAMSGMTMFSSSAAWKPDSRWSQGLVKMRNSTPEVSSQPYSSLASISLRIS